MSMSQAGSISAKVLFLESPHVVVRCLRSLPEPLPNPRKGSDALLVRLKSWKGRETARRYVPMLRRGGEHLAAREGEIFAPHLGIPPPHRSSVSLLLP